MTLRTKSQRTWDDVKTCLNVVETMQPFLIPYTEDSRGEVDTESKLAASVTLIKACDTIEQLLARVTQFKDEDKLEATIIRDIRASTRAENERAGVLKAAKRPAILYRPALIRNGLQWVAYYGDIKEVDACIIGVGDSAEDAMADFDREFSARIKSTKRAKKKK